MKRFGIRVLAWAKQHERHLSTVFFLGGFVGDLITYVLIPVSFASYLFLANLALAGICTLGSHTLASQFPQKERAFARTFHFLLPLGAQFFIGSLLSGFLIFYTKSAVLFVSWPFLLLLLLVFLGNEAFRDYRSYLAFQTVLFFFAVYAYLIFALPLWVHRIGPDIFLWSTALAAGVFALFLLLVASLGWQRLKRTLGMIVLGSSAIVILVVSSYFTGLVPPIPLTLQQSGIYHSLIHTAEGTYAVQAEEKGIFPLKEVVHHVPGTPLVAYSSVFAPASFSLNIVHVWKRYDTETKSWIEEARVTFPVRGGRDGGYRGYSEKSSVTPGEWMIFVETSNAQVIGRMRFTVVEVPVQPALHTEIK